MGGAAPASLGGRIEAEAKRAQGASLASCELGTTWSGWGSLSGKQEEGACTSFYGIRRPGQA